MREEHILVHNSKELKLKEEDIVIIQDDKKNSLSIKIVHQLLSGRDGITTAFELQAGKSLWNVLFNTCIHRSYDATKK